MVINPIKKWNSMPTPVKSAIAFTISSLFIRGITFLVTPLFTRLMDSSEYGIVTTYNSWNTIIEVFALIGLTSAGVFNTGLNDYKDKRSQFISSVLSLCNIVTIIVFGVIFFVKAYFYPKFILPYELLIIMFVQFIFQPAQIFWITRERYEYRYKAATIVSIVSSIASQVVAVLFIYFSITGSASSAKIIGNCIGALLFYVPIYVMLQFRGKCLVDWTIWKQILVFALPLIPHYLAQHVMASADRIMIANMYFSSGAAIYGVVSAISLIATVVWSAVNASLVPYSYENMNTKTYDGIKNITNSLVLAYGGLCFCVALIAPEVLFILAPPEYASGVYAVPPIAAVAFLNAPYNLYATVEFFHKKSTGIAVATIVSCLVNIGLNALLIPRYGFVAAAYTTLISNIVLILMHYYFYRKCQGERVYSDKLFLLISIVTIGACEMCNLLYLNTTVRYAVILVLLVVAVVFRNRIIGLLKRIRKK